MLRFKFADEARFRIDYHSGTTGARQAGLNTDLVTIIAFRTEMMRDIPGMIFLIVDGHSARTFAETGKFPPEHKSRLRLFYLPPCSPELDPDEWVWKNIKHNNVGKTAIRTADEARKESVTRSSY